MSITSYRKAFEFKGNEDARGSTITDNKINRKNKTFLNGYAAQRGLWPSRPRGFFITHNDAPQSVGLLCTSDQLFAETST
jgi:hypothetical protein